MAKGNNNVRNKKPHSSKPYDVSNSFVRKVTSGVSSLLPQASWISRWFASSSSAVEDPPSTSNSGENEEELANQSPPAKRARIPLNRSFPANSFRVSSPLDRGETHPWPSESVTSPIPNIFSDTSAPGPSGLSRTPVATGPFPTSNTTEGLEGKINGDGGSDSSESTSGCSSLAPQRATNIDTSPVHRTSDNKMSNHMSSYSLFPSATHKLSPSVNPSLSRRRPSFNVSSFGSPNLDSSKLSRESSLNSPFYIGRTMYGGASAYRRPREGASSERFLSSTRRGGVAVRPVNEKSQPAASAEASMSQTARRILEALEQFSSPVSEARRMPLPSQPALSAKRRRPLESLSTSPSKSPAVPTAATNPLIIPMPPERLRLHRLQDATEAARRIASSVASSNKYTLRNEEGSQRTGAGKVTKAKPLDVDEIPLPLNLPNVSLPITILPSFELFNVPVLSTNSNARTNTNSDPKLIDKNEENSEKVEVEKKKSNTVSSMNTGSTCTIETSAATTNSGTFVFSVSKPVDPKSKVGISNNTHPTGTSKSSAMSSFVVKGVQLTTPADSDKNPVTNDFVFSTPTVLSSKTKDASVSHTRNFDFCKPELLDSSKYSTKLKRNETNGFHKLHSSSKVDDVQQSVVLREGSGKPTSQTSECDAKSPAALKAGTTGGKQNNGWGAKFTVPDTWECSSCMVRNKNNVKVCVCCGTNQPTTSSVSKDSDEKGSVVKSKDSPLVSSGWGNGFALQPGMWECTSCLVRNKSSDVNCVACTTPKPNIQKSTAPMSTSPCGNWGSQFKLTAGKWECSACLVRNDEKNEKCVACTTQRVIESNNKKSDTSVSVDSKSTSGWGQKFKKPSGSWECPVCMIQNKTADMKCAACQEPKPGIDTNRSSSGGSIKFNFDMPSGASGFKFGIDKSELKQSDNSSATFTFQASGKSETDSPSVPVGFTFGVPSSDSKVPSGIKFGIPAESSSTAKPESKGESDVKSSSDAVPAVSSASSVFSVHSAQKSSQQSESPKVAGVTFGIPASNMPMSANENRGEAKKSVNPSDSDSSQKVINFTAYPANSAVGSSEETEKKSSVFVAPVQKTEQKDSKEMKQSFNFGTSSVNVTSTTSVCTVSSTSAASPKTPGFSFTSNVTPSNTPTTVAVTSTTCAVPTPISSSASSVFSFSSKPSFTATTSAPTFSFGNSGQTTSNSFFGSTQPGQFKSSGESLFSKPTTTTVPVFGGSTVAPKASFGASAASPATVISAATTTTTNASTFVSPSYAFVSSNTTTTTVPFGSGISKPTFANVSSGFGSVTTSAVAGVSASASVSVNTTSNNANPSPSFGMPATNTSFGVPTTSSGFSSTSVPTFGSSTAPSFGVPATTASNQTTAPLPSFGAPTPVAFGSSASAGTGFGAANQTQTSTLFGSNNPPNFGSASVTPAFGSSAANFGSGFGSATTAPTFGTATPAVTTTSTTPSLPPFGSFANAAKPAQGAFLFGSNPTTTAAQSSNFSFSVPSQASTGQPVASSSAGFTFGSGAASSATIVTTSTSTAPSATAASATAASTFGGFTFAGSGSAAAPNTSNPPAIFGNTAAAAATPSAPVFGAPTISSSAPAAPTFGSESATNTSIFRPPAFNFGSGGSQQPFSFGSSAQSGTAQSSGTSGFSFGQNQLPAQPQSQPLQFNPNVRPSFNFTGGATPRFTASAPPSTPAPQRRVKKAVRRTLRP